MSDKDYMAEQQSPIVESTAWKDVAQLLLGAVADHAVHCGQGDGEAYRNHISASMEVLQNTNEPAQILMSAGGVAQAFTQHAEKTQQQVEALVTDVNETAQMFLSHLEKLHGDADTQSILAELRSTMEKALAKAELKIAREAALASLDQLAQHAAAKRTQSLELTSNLQDRITILEQSVPQGVKPPPPPQLLSIPLPACPNVPTRSWPCSAHWSQLPNPARNSTPPSSTCTACSSPTPGLVKLSEIR